MTEPGRSNPTPEPGRDPRLEIPPELQRSYRPREEAPSGESLASTAKAWAVAFDFIFTIIAGAILGWLVDRWQGTDPTGLLIGLSLGFVLAFIRIVRHAQRDDRAASEKRRRETESRSRQD